LWISIASLAFGVVYVTVSVIARATNRFTVHGAEEFGSFALVFVFYFGLAQCFRSGAFVRISVLPQHLPTRAQEVIVIARYILAFALVALLEYYIFKVFLQARDTGQLTMDLPQIPIFWPVLGIVIGNGIFCIELLAQSLTALLDPRSRIDTSAVPEANIAAV
jgi:TRAP-type C4-dicarboxylate transport system permease small subunit